MASPSLPHIDVETATIANSASLSATVNLASRVLVGVLMPATWTAADLTFQVSLDGSTFVNAYDATGAEVTAVVDASTFVWLSPSIFAGAKFLKVRSGTSDTPVNQGGARSIELSLRDIN